MECMEQITHLFQQATIPYRCNESLALHTSFKIGGPAAVFCTPTTVEQLVKAVGICKEQGARYYLLGNGSNLLFADEGFAGVVICTKELPTTLRVEEHCITATAGTDLKEICQLAAEQSLTGMEFAYGIPGSVGGAVYMNAGAYGGEMKDVLLQVICLDDEGVIQTLSADQMELGYRSSIFERTGWCVLEVTVQLKPGEKQQIQSTMDELMQRRIDKQPLDLPSAGSAFKRPVGAFAGGLIDQCGLRGYRVGDAAISEKHCGFIVNLGHATCAQVLELADKVSSIVQEQTGYKLEKEIRVVK